MLSSWLSLGSTGPMSPIQLQTGESELPGRATPFPIRQSPPWMSQISQNVNDTAENKMNILINYTKDELETGKLTN